MSELLFDAAIAASGEAFLDLERQILAAAPELAPVLAARAQEASGFEGVLARTLLRRIEGDEDLPRLLGFMEETERELELKVVDQPPPEWAAGRLLEFFSDRAAPILAVYAAKLNGIWPYWRTAAAIVYLRHVAGDAAGAGLVELVATTESETFRRLAADALAEIGDEGALVLIEERLGTATDAGKEALEEAAAAIRAKT